MEKQMQVKTTITKSRSGHYTVTVRKDGAIVFYRGKLELCEARHLGKKAAEEISAKGGAA